MQPVKKALYIFAILLFSVTATAKKKENFSKILKNPDVEVKYKYALEYYNNGDYKKAITLFEDVQNGYRGTETAQHILYYLAMCYVKRKDYESAEHYLTNYLSTYVRGEYIEECNFMLAYCYYKESPHYELDQTSTVKAIEQLNHCLVLYPNHEKAEDAKTMRTEMLDKLARRELANATLYYNLGNYRGNNYRAAIVVSQNAINDYPECEYLEQFAYIIVRSKYKEAINSNTKKIYIRSEDAWDECYYFLNEFPETKHRKEIEKMAAHLEKINKSKLKL